VSTHALPRKGVFRHILVRECTCGSAYGALAGRMRRMCVGRTLMGRPSGSARPHWVAPGGSSSTLLMSAFRETREGVSEIFASVGTQSKRARTPKEHSAILTEFAILAMSSLSAYPCTQADKAEQLSTNHRARRFRNSSGKVRRAVRIVRSSSWLMIYPPRAKDSSMSSGHIADDTYLRPVARSKITTPRPPNLVFLHASVYTSSQGVSSASRRHVSTGKRVKGLRKKANECIRASFHASCSLSPQI
jgi:hypothetical protein